MDKKWPPLDPGTKVKTYKPNTDKRHEWTDEGWGRRRWGVIGVIVTHHDAHGLYYDVRHGDGWIAGYDPSEFDVVLESQTEWENVVIRGEVLVNGEARQKVLIDITTPKDGLFLVTVDPEGKELSRTPIPTK